MSQLQYLGTTVTNQNLIQEEIKRRLNSGNACYPPAVKKYEGSIWVWNMVSDNKRLTESVREQGVEENI
jgi:hypothetical protein